MNHSDPETADSNDDTEQAGSEMLRKEPIDTSVTQTDESGQTDQTDARPGRASDTGTQGQT